MSVLKLIAKDQSKKHHHAHDLYNCISTSEFGTSYKYTRFAVELG